MKRETERERETFFSNWLYIHNYAWESEKYLDKKVWKKNLIKTGTSETIRQTSSMTYNCRIINNNNILLQL